MTILEIQMLTLLFIILTLSLKSWCNSTIYISLITTYNRNNVIHRKDKHIKYLVFLIQCWSEFHVFGIALNSVLSSSLLINKFCFHFSLFHIVLALCGPAFNCYSVFKGIFGNRSFRLRVRSPRYEVYSPTSNVSSPSYAYMSVRQRPKYFVK